MPMIDCVLFYAMLFVLVLMFGAKGIAMLIINAQNECTLDTEHGYRVHM